MKISTAASGACVALGVFLCFVACKKSSDLILSPDQLTKSTYLKLEKVNKTTLDYSQINSESVSIDVSGYGEDLQSVIVYVSTNNSLDSSTWRKVKEFPTTDNKASLVVTAADLASALGIPASGLSLGSSYTLYNMLVTKSGNRVSLQNMNTDFEASPDYHMAMRWGAFVICPFTGGMTGNYTVVQDAWQDWSPGDVVQVADGPGPNQIDLYQVYPNPAYGNPVNHLVVNVDPATGAATIPAVVFGDYTCCGYTASTLSGSSGFVFSCTGTINLSIHIFAAGFGDQGYLKLVLQR